MEERDERRITDPALVKHACEVAARTADAAGLSYEERQCRVQEELENSLAMGTGEPTIEFEGYELYPRTVRPTSGHFAVNSRIR